MNEADVEDDEKTTLDVPIQAQEQWTPRLRQKLFSPNKGCASNSAQAKHVPVYALEGGQYAAVASASGIPDIVPEEEGDQMEQWHRNQSQWCQIKKEMRGSGPSPPTPSALRC